MSNGLYNGLDNGLRSGVYNGLDSGVRNGMFENETVIKKQVIQEGLQLYLDFSNPRCYNSGRGQIGDTVSNLVNGSTKKLTIGNLTGRTTANAPYVEYNPIPYWNNYTLNGTGQNYLTSPNNTDFDIGIGTSGATWSMWVNIPVSCPDYNVFMGKTIAGFVVGRWQMYFMNTMAVGFLIQIDNNTLIQSANNVLKLDANGLVPLGNIPGTLTGKSADKVDNIHFRINNGSLQYSTDGSVWYDVSVIAKAWKTADLYLSSAASNTWYTVCDITGKGVLTRISALHNSTALNNAIDVRVTIDGISYLFDITTGVYTRTLRYYETNTPIADFIHMVKFDISLKVEVMQTTGTSTAPLQASVDYGLV